MKQWKAVIAEDELEVARQASYVHQFKQM